LRVVLDTYILKLATFPRQKNAAALVFELSRAGLIEVWASPAILQEYADVLGDRPDFVAEIVQSCRLCHPLTELRIIRHEPDNRFLECAFAANAEHVITVNTAPGHFDREQFRHDCQYRGDVLRRSKQPRSSACDGQSRGRGCMGISMS
jgi:predicted nucleic acid-binding protein